MPTTRDLLTESRFDYLSEADKRFILSFDEEMENMGYSAGGAIGDGYCWGPYMIIYAKKDVKAKKVVARVFLREGGSVLRLYFPNKGIDAHRDYIERAPQHILAPFLEGHGDCRHCEGRGENCKFKKRYTLFGRTIEKCNGIVFEYHQPAEEKTPDYVALLREFYAPKR